MREFLYDHALKNVWCNPHQDLQATLRPKRISVPAGAKTSVKHMWGSLPLPGSGVYHVFQIGQIHPTLLGLFPRRRVWMTLSEMMGTENLIADVYTDKGLMIPRFDSWIMITEKQTVILAVKAQPRIANLGVVPVYLRLYSNTYFGSDRADATRDFIECVGLRVRSADEALLFQRRINNTRNRVTGLTTVYVNGAYVSEFNPNILSPGDSVEYVYDSTVKQVLDFPINALPTFDSLRDLKGKYLLSHGGNQVGGEIIDYRDDIDVYLVKHGIINDRPGWDGVLFHKNLDDSLRMVTHRDYSVPASTVNGYLNARPGWSDIQQLSLRLHIRHSGYSRPLQNEHHRIKDLYRLNFAQRAAAMTGINALSNIWHAASLENAEYVRLMDAQREDLNFAQIQTGYGYNAVTRLVAESPLPVEIVNSRRQVSLPFMLQVNSTIYEYDAQGKLLGWFLHAAGEEYTPQLPQTQMIEGRCGTGKFKIGTTFGTAQTLMEPGVTYRFYATPIRNGQPSMSEWEDVTGDENFYLVDSDNRAVWQVSDEDYAYAVRNDKDFLAYDLSLSPTNGLLKFTIDGFNAYPNPAQGVCSIPLGVIELWLNGRALIENLDYFAKGLQFVITNKKYLVPGNQQRITVRASGFCKPDMTREAPNEAGFVRYGQLSRNNRFNTRDDKVMRIVVDGRTFIRDAFKYVEDDDAVRMENIPNGVPYVIDDVLVPMRNLANNQTTETYRNTSLVVDAAVENYLTLRLPEPAKTTPDAILDKYPIYSPFASTVMYDLINGVISMDEFKGQYSEQDVRDALEGYEYLLDFDPTLKNIDLEHVSIHPHNLNSEAVLDIYQYNFLNRAIKTYLDDQVDITRFISLKPGYV